MKIIGLTGGIASGKSTVMQTLQRLGAAVIDTDKVAHECMEPGQAAWKKLVEVFGHTILREDTTIDRKRLGDMVFADDEKLKRLDAIMHPVILAETARRAQKLSAQQPERVIVEEIPLLYELGLEKSGIFDEIWVVWVDRNCQIRRLMLRDGCTEQMVEQRLRVQLPLDAKAEKACRVIDNRGLPEEAVRQTEQYFQQFLQK